MKAIVQREYGSADVLAVADIDKPEVRENEVLVRVHAASVNPYEWHFMTGRPHLVRIEAGLLRPKRKPLGVDLAGRVEAVGEEVERFQTGDEVFGGSRGSFAEYVSVPEDRIVRKPANVTFEQAAAVPMAGLTALQGLRDKGRIQPGSKVLINGVSGGVGTFAVQIAKSFGAEVTGVCSSRNVDMVRSIGADKVIDYTTEDLLRSGERYDLILDMVGSHSLTDCRSVLSPKGVYVLVGQEEIGDWIGPLTLPIRMLVGSLFTSQRMVPLLASFTREDLLVLQELLETEKMKPVIDRTYELSDVPEALRQQGEGHAQGKTVITI